MRQVADEWSRRHRGRGGLIACYALILLAVSYSVYDAIVGGPLISFALSSAFMAKTKGDVSDLSMALDRYAIENGGRYPVLLIELVIPNAAGERYLEGETLPNDKWGVPYQYEAPRPGYPNPRVFTLGKDGAEGGEGDDADYSNWLLLGLDDRGR